MHNSIVIKAIHAVNTGQMSFCKFITANDHGLTGLKQYGIYISHNAWSMLFSRCGLKGENIERKAAILWDDDFETNSRFKYYGLGKNEYRITRLGKKIPY